MKTKGLLRIVVLFFCVIGFSGCNDDESEFSSTEIQQALFDMKGTYKGAVEVSYYRGKEIATFPDGIAVSKDSLIFKLPLSPIAEMIKDENISRHLREIGLSGNIWLVSFKISYLCLPLFYETRTTPSCHPSGCAYRQL